MFTTGQAGRRGWKSRAGAGLPARWEILQRVQLGIGREQGADQVDLPGRLDPSASTEGPWLCEEENGATGRLYGGDWVEGKDVDWSI